MNHVSGRKIEAKVRVHVPVSVMLVLNVYAGAYYLCNVGQV